MVCGICKEIPTGSAQVAKYAVGSGGGGGGVTTGLTPSSSRGLDQVILLRATTGAPDNRLSPYFPYPDSFISGDLTISPFGDCRVNC